MVDKKFWFFISYLSAFFAVYVGALLFSVIPTVFKMDIEWGSQGAGNAFIYEANSTFASTATLSQWLPVTGLVLASIAVICVLVSGFSFKKGVESN